MGNLLTTLDLSAKNTQDPPALEDTYAEEEIAAQCPADAIALYATNKDELNARAIELMQESAAIQPVAQTQPAAASPESLLAKSMKDWITSWISVNVQSYLDNYAPNFVPADGSNTKTWREKRKNTLRRAVNIAIDVADLK